MTCRHSRDDRSCSSHPDYVKPYEPPSPPKTFMNSPSYAGSLYAEPTTPDKYKYNIIDVERVGLHLVLKVEYPNCKKCSYEGKKVMVFLNVSEKDALKWREIDPHFRAPTGSMKSEHVAPSPACRFPASAEGWSDAIAYARGKIKG